MKCEKWIDVLKIENIERHIQYAREVFNNKPIEKQENIRLRKWQQEIIEMLNKPADDRTINWIYDKEG